MPNGATVRREAAAAKACGGGDQQMDETEESVPAE
jgi:hypothetical protein